MAVLTTKTVGGQTYQLKSRQENGQTVYYVTSPGFTENGKDRAFDDEYFTSRTQAKTYFDNLISTVQRGAGEERNRSRESEKGGFLDQLLGMNGMEKQDGESNKDISMPPLFADEETNGDPSMPPLFADRDDDGDRSPSMPPLWSGEDDDDDDRRFGPRF